MIDHVLYTSSVGAKDSLRRTQLLSNNLANMNTVGFHADYESMVTSDIKSEGLQTRSMSKIGQIYTEQKTGPINYTGRSLDVAIDGPGFIATQNKSGEIGYTRYGSLDVTPEGLLVTGKGDLVLGQSGAITIPPASQVNINQYGVISAQLKGEDGTTITEVGRIKLANFAPNQISKGDDGLYYPKNAGDEGNGMPVQLVPESLEGSNVDPIRQLVELIDLSRQFDSHSKILKIAEENATKANGLLNIQQ